jgi:phospho-N-acetylmuramoyl-pentapeptide-transferase
MGGLIILASLVIPTLLFTDVLNPYILLMLFTTIWLGADLVFWTIISKYLKKTNAGLPGKLKIIGQVILGIVVATAMYFDDGIVLREKTSSD